MSTVFRAGRSLNLRRERGRASDSLAGNRIHLTTYSTPKFGKGGSPTVRHSFYALAIFAALTGPAVAQDGRIQRGRVFVQTHCAGCHAIGRTGVSPLTAAPPFRDLHKRYPVENLAEAFAEGIVTGHPSMPEFRLDATQINDLLAYLESLEP